MYRNMGRTLLFGGLLWSLAGCGEVVPGGTASISGTVTAPAGGDVAGARVFACYDNEPNCARLGEVTLTEAGASSSYQLGSLPAGSYSIYALKESVVEDYLGWYIEPGDPSATPALVTPPAANIDIRMIAVPKAERARLPEEIRALSSTRP
jgi:hypothetical protein